MFCFLLQAPCSIPRNGIWRRCKVFQSDGVFYTPTEKLFGEFYFSKFKWHTRLLQWSILERKKHSLQVNVKFFLQEFSFLFYFFFFITGWLIHSTWMPLKSARGQTLVYTLSKWSAPLNSWICSGFCIKCWRKKTTI
jgi:hypothetical protein